MRARNPLGKHLRIALLAVLFAACLPFAPTPTAAQRPVSARYVVDTGADTTASTCSAAPNDCSLRGAITNVNTSDLWYSEISFDPAVTLIALIRPLPVIIARGTHIVGIGGVPRIDGIFMRAGDMFTINATFVRIEGLSIVNGTPLANGVYADIRIQTGMYVEVTGNYLGTLPPGPGVTTCTPNPTGTSAVTRNSSAGVIVDAAASSIPGAHVSSNTIACHGGPGVHIEGTDYVTVDNNFIGTNVTGENLPNQGDGIRLSVLDSHGPYENTIDNNTLAGNSGYGIQVIGSHIIEPRSRTANVNEIVRNRIGITSTGGVLPNAHGGIALQHGALYTLIGGGAPDEGNIIAGNTGNGITISSSFDTIVLGNRIGVDANNVAVPNTGNGVLVEHSQGTRIGVDYYGRQFKANIIAGNAQHGIELVGADTHRTQITGNYIGVTPALADRGNGLTGIHSWGTVATTVIANTVMDNDWAGVWLQGASQAHLLNNTISWNGHDGVALTDGTTGTAIGGADGSLHNTITRNGSNGIFIRDASSVNNRVQSTTITGNGMAGIRIDGGGENMVLDTVVDSNGAEGIRLDNSIQNTLTGNASLDNGAAGVLINASSETTLTHHASTGNGGAGIAVTGAGASGNTLLPAFVFNNRGLAIDLGNDGATPNDPGDADSGPNGLLNYPEVTGVSGATVSGTTCPLCSVLVYEAIGTGAGAGGSGVRITTVRANGSGHWSATLSAGQVITLQACTGACEPGANTSEFSPHTVTVLR